MKKIIMVCSCLALLLALSVPTFAATNDPYDLIGEWTWNDTVNGIQDERSFKFVSNGREFVKVVPTYKGATDPEYFMSYMTSGFDYVREIYSSKSGWLNPSYRVFSITSADGISEGLANHIKANAVKTTLPVCDGSTCPATDVNYDGVCDDCGMALMMSIRLYPSVDGLWDKAVYPYGVLYMRNDNIPSLYFLDNPITTSDGVDFRFNGGNFVVYNLVDGAWTYERTGQGAVEFPDLDSGRILKVSHDVNFQGAVLMYKDSDFFPTPLWETVELVTQGAMSEEMPKMGGTMTILVACGVGLMACLVGLSLFGKRSLISRS